MANDKLNQRAKLRNGNSTLNSAKYSSANTDEWYTTYDTIAEELSHYKNQFKGKIVYGNRWNYAFRRCR